MPARARVSTVDLVATVPRRRAARCEGRILIVDDERPVRADLARVLHGEGYDVETAADAFKALKKYDEFEPMVVITDLEMPGMSGLGLLEQLQLVEEPASVIIISGFADTSTGIGAIRAGAFEFLEKPLRVPELLSMVAKAMQYQRVRAEARQLRERLRERYRSTNIVGDHPALRRVCEIIEQVAPSRATVLISGESGTGKELVANAIHELSPRRDRPFVKLHCAALSENLVESELFGHERGAFTGALARTDGRLQMADGGTLFLDEISEISPNVQVKLLRFLQEQEFERVGGTETIHVDVRLVAATNRCLEDEVAERRFRNDLYFRLNVVGLEVPPLRARRSDIPQLATLFLERYARQNQKEIEGWAPDALALLMQYDWPGNVRELEHAIERAVIFTQGPQIGAASLPPSVRPAEATGLPVPPHASMADYQKYAILETLKAVGGSTSKAAACLGVSTRMIQYRLHEYSEAPRTNEPVLQDDDHDDERRLYEVP